MHIIGWLSSQEDANICNILNPWTPAFDKYSIHALGLGSTLYLSLSVCLCLCLFVSLCLGHCHHQTISFQKIFVFFRKYVHRVSYGSGQKVSHGVDQGVTQVLKESLCPKFELNNTKYLCLLELKNSSSLSTKFFSNSHWWAVFGNWINRGILTFPTKSHFWPSLRCIALLEKLANWEIKENAVIAVKVKVIANEPLIANKSIILKVREDRAMSESF